MLFHEAIQNLLRRLPAAPGRVNPVEPLAHLEYAQELALKKEALAAFWADRRLPGTPETLVAAPRPRQYRTTTRRHAFAKRGLFDLTVSPGSGRAGAASDHHSALEPPAHTALYAFLRQRLNEPHFRPLANALNHIIIRGSYAERCVIFNVHELDGTIVRKLKIIASHLPEADRAVVSAFMFNDPSQSKYYLDDAPVEGALKTKKLFGPDLLRVDFGGNRYRFFPTVFSQVNEAMVPVMLAAAKELLQPATDQHLVDLYCGYGLFTHHLAAGYAHACGLEASPLSIEAAEMNARYHPETNKVTFRVCQITGDRFLNQLPRPDQHKEVVLTDPPRVGMPPPVIAALAGRKPVRVLQASCGTDEIPGQLAAWQAHGYRLVTVRPLDMFAGTPHLETLLLLERA